MTVTRVGTQAVVRLSGAVDGTLAESLSRARAEVGAVRPTRVAVDLDAVTSIDAAGVDFLVAVWQDCRDVGLPLRFVDVPDEVRRHLDRARRGHVLRRAQPGMLRS